jgi:hypothetical protein
MINLGKRWPVVRVYIGEKRELSWIAESLEVYEQAGSAKGKIDVHSV